MRWISLIGLISVGLMIASCSRESEETLLNRGTEAVNAGEYDKAIEAFETLLDEYPDGRRRPDALYALGGLYQRQGRNIEGALSCYRAIVDQHPDHDKAPNALFLIGFLYNNELQQLDSARAAYEQFLQRYPTSDMAASAEFELSTLGKTPEEIISQRAEVAQTGKKSGKKASP